MKMTLSYEWLCSLVDNLDKKNPTEIGLALTAVGAECEEIQILNPNAQIELAQIKEISTIKENLHLVKVQTTSATFLTVSNSPSLILHHYVLFAPNGTTLFNGQTIQSKKFEEHQTEGILLALEQLGIENKSTDIAHLGDDLDSAKDMHKVFTQELDAIYTLDVPGNRPDWLSVQGLARALSIYFDLPLTTFNNTFTQSKDSSLEVKIQSDRCFRYNLTSINNLSPQKSSAQTKKRLHLLGMRPISYLVDLSNLIMLETGQPTHMFDANKITGSIIVRQAKEGETMTLLDDSEVTLTSDDLLICDEEKILALAGIMGAKNSGVDAHTQNVHLEVASFHGTWVRRSAKRLGLKTESSLRFEKHISSGLVPQAQATLCAIIQQQSPQVQIALSNETITKTQQLNSILVTCEQIRTYLGADEISDEFIISCLEKIGCSVVNNNSQLTVQANGERNDLQIKEDLMEEIARYYGYDKIPARSYRPSSVTLNPEKTFLETLRPLLRGMGISEAVTVPFRSPEQREFYQLPKSQVNISNPLNSEWTELRTQLFDGLLESLKLNMNRAFEKNISLSEIASVFEKSGNDFIETQNLSFVISHEENPYQKALNVLKNILYYAKLTEYTAQNIDPNQYPFLHPKNSFEIIAQGQVIGFFGEIHPVLMKKLDLSDKKDFPSPTVCEINFQSLKDSSAQKGKIQNLNPNPPIFRDVTVSVPQDAMGINIQEKIKKLNTHIQDIEFISVFQNEKLQELSQKNLSLRIRFESETPLDAQEIDQFIKTLLQTQF